MEDNKPDDNNVATKGNEAAANPRKKDDSDPFAEAWNKMYNEAKLLSAEPGSSKQALALLEAMTKLAFGGNTRQKYIVATHGQGGLELTVALVRNSIPNLGSELSDVDDDDLAAMAIGGMKCVKTIVLRNPTGRSRCRSAGVFSLINDLFLSYCCEGSTAGKVVEETLTTLAAICMGDDLNALQAALTLSTHVDRASTVFSATGTNLSQVCTYLKALFNAVFKEQPEFKQRILASKESGEGEPSLSQPPKNASVASFFNAVSAAERKARDAEGCLSQRKHELTEQHCSQGLETIKRSLPSGKEEDEPISELLSPLYCRLYELRAVARLSREKFEDAIQDVDCFLEIGCKEGAKTQFLSASTVGRMHQVRAEALSRLGRMEEAKESIGKARLLTQSQSETG